MGKRSQRARTTVIGRDLERVHRFTQHLLRERKLDDWEVYWLPSIAGSDGGGVTLAHARRIVFSARYMAMMSSDERRDAARHEVAHAIVGVAEGHSNVWRDAFIELGGSGESGLHLSWQLYPWWGICPDEHEFVSVSDPESPDFVCQDKAHQSPVRVKCYKRNPKSRAFDLGIAYMACKYPEPESVPTFTVGDVVDIIPFGSPELDNRTVEIVEVLGRSYRTRCLDNGEELFIFHEGVGPHK